MAMPTLINYHVIDSHNVGDLLSSPLHYFEFPGFTPQARDIRAFQPSQLPNDLDSPVIIGGGGLLFEHFLPQIVALKAQPAPGKRILWGVGQQTYALNQLPHYRQFDYRPYVEHCDLVGIRDYDVPWPWVPCASCMHPAFNQPRTPQHEIVVFSHKKFQLHLPGFPHLTHTETTFETVLDFLGSGETILTSSFHGAYWGTLLGRKVLAFPFSSKFISLKHTPTLYPLKTWSDRRFRLAIRGKTLYELKYQNKFRCTTEGWQSLLPQAQSYPESLAECRDRNQEFYAQAMDVIC
jgi:hypothetical protein